MRNRRLLLGIVTALCLGALCGCFLFWQHSNPLSSIAEYGIVGAELVLFALLGARFLPCWFDAWSAGPLPECSRQKERLTDILSVLTVLCAFQAVLSAIALLYAKADGRNFADVWRAGDSGHYLDIAENWYRSEGTEDELVRLVFFPLYPLLVRSVALTGLKYLSAACLVSTLCYLGAGFYLYMLARLDSGPADAKRTLKYFLLLPGAFFCFCAMTESLFILLSAACLYYTRKRKYALSCCLAALAAFSRAPGIILFVPVCFEMLSELCTAQHGGRRHMVKKLPLLLIIPLGFFAYMVINYCVSGSFTQFLTYEHEHWSQHLSWFFATVRYQFTYLLDYMGSGEYSLAAALWAANLLAQFGSLILMIGAVKKIRASYTAYFIAYFVITMGTSWLLSAPRYLFACVSLPFALAGLTENKTADDCATVLLTGLSLLYFIAYFKGLYVY